MSIPEHILLFSFLFLFFYVWGKYNYNEKKDHKFWTLALIPIILYSIIVGSRYGWGPDYIFYKSRLENALTFPEEQIGFKWLNQAIYLIGFNYVGGYIIYSLIFSTCAFVLIRGYAKESRYMYGFFIPATLQLVTSGIRQGLALSFLFLAIYFLNKKKWIYVFLCILTGVSIHTANLIPIFFIGIFYVFSKNPINFKISIPLYLFFTFFFDSKKIGFMSNYLQYLSLGNKFQSYIDTSDEWFGYEAVNDLYTQGTFALIMSSFFYISLIYLGYKALKIRPSSNIYYLYNSLVFGIILYRAVFLFEILRRFAEPLIFLYFIVLGYTIYVFENQLRISKKYKRNSLKFDLMFRKYKIGVLCIFLYLFFFWGRFIFLNPEAIFFWNK